MTSGYLNMFGDMPRQLRKYVKYNGWHFNKGAYDFACSVMDEPGMKMTKRDVNQLLEDYGVDVINRGNYDYCYVAMMCKARCFGSSIVDDMHLALFVKDACDNNNAADGSIMLGWLSQMAAAGVSVPWDDFL